MLEFEGDFESDLPRDELWKYFTDPDVLAECAPGCDTIKMQSPHELTATIAVGVGSVKPTFDVDAVVTAADEPELLEMQADGNASRNAFDLVAEMALVELDAGGTRVDWAARAEVSGMIASLGQRALGSVSNKLVTDFFEDLEEKAREGEPAESKLEAAPQAEASLE
ncbi:MULTISPECIES: CoxG family protein [Halorussus]|uniref:CoxG family protein n=1 Tax=Halorussus TaxID=1070314 RepID=UPI00209F192C|nr:carbon monoxide dehydrogenase subunit G [Halorussus vallis]USZ78326.1 carbon monoxide dehydrogenase subunit G [Halorussus vallis]USZ78349.1 carbon monoxide dehydrogenase subunit G [Halorussus vallis]